MENRIKNYYYQSVDDSILSPYYKKICNVIIDFVPSKSSPNVLTLIGLFGVFVSTFIVIFLKNSIGLFYTCLSCSLLLFFYQIMDTLDGMQGRRVGMYYNPTTELFDHGCDSITTCCVLYNLLNLTNLINEHFIIAIFYTMFCITNFYLPTWEHSNTGIMHFRQGIANPTESIFFIKILFLVIGFFPNFFQNIYVIVFGLISLGFFTVVNFMQCYDDTMNSVKKSYLQKIKSILPLPLAYIYTLYLIGFYNDKIYYINIVSPLLTAILNLIWYEISGNSFDLISVLIIFLVNICDFTLGMYFFVPHYIFVFRNYTKIMCDILGMKHFYSVNI